MVEQSPKEYFLPTDAFKRSFIKLFEGEGPYHIYKPNGVKQQQQKCVFSAENWILAPGGKRNYFWEIALMRIRTIFFEVMEKRGILVQSIDEIKNFKSSDLETAAKTNYSHTYRQYFYDTYNTLPKPQKLNIQWLVFDTFYSDQAVYKSPDIAAQFQQQIGPYGWLFKNDPLQATDNFINQTQAYDFQFDKTVCWFDIRISRSYFRSHLNVYYGQNFMLHIERLKRGYFSPDERKESMSILQQYTLSFHVVIYNNYFGLISLQPRRIVLHDKKGVTGFAYFQFIELVALPKSQKHIDSIIVREKWRLNYAKLLKMFKLRFEQKYQKNPNAYECFKPDHVLAHLPKSSRYSTAFKLSNCLIVEQANSSQLTLRPLFFQDQTQVDPEIAGKFQRDESGELFCALEFKADKFASADSNILNDVSEEKGSQQLLNLIKSIPNIKFKLTPEQELMISTPQNLLCLGRSGTGKTTSSALRLFATDAYYKYRTLLKNYRTENPDARLADFKAPTDFLQSSSNLRLLFVSASPVLVNEVKTFYLDFKSHFTLELEQSRAGQKSEAAKSGFQDDLATYIEIEIKAIEQEEQIEKQMSLARSMEDLSNEDFPLFLTVKRLLLMIDATTTFPFFCRDNKGQQIGMKSDVQWHNEQGGVFMINNYFKADTNYDSLIKQLGEKIINLETQMESSTDQEQINTESKATKTFEANLGLASMMNCVVNGTQATYNLKSHNLSQEVDFEAFRTRFWPKASQQTRTKLQPLVVWTEIYSEIKGRFDSWKYSSGGIDVNLYVKWNRTKGQFLLPEEKSQIYMIFLLYEKWKEQTQCYDLNDLVNHIIRQVKTEAFKPEMLVHFLMVDEVQDLTQNIISLFMMLTEQNVFFSGDTAQTIAKGIGFRFFDLKSVFSRTNYESATQFQVPKVLQLVKNFRSHARILDLANSVVNLLEVIFPKTIDKLMKEISDLDGAKPIVIDTVDSEKFKGLLNKYLVWGESSEIGSSKAGKQLGCNQVVIVRDQEAKTRIPHFMRDMLILTVYEAKGLEFTDVILFNFFKDSPCDDQWKLLQEVQQIKTLVKVQTETFTDFDKLDHSFEVIKEEQIDTTQVKSGFEYLTVLKLDRDSNEVYRKFANVCTELKLLYVAITRPKKMLIIYDEDMVNRKPIQKIWQQMNVVDVVTNQMISDFSLIPDSIRKSLKLDSDPCSEGDGDPKQIQMSWRLQGFKLFKVKYYRAAIQCFQQSGDEHLVIRCLAYENADLATSYRGQADSKLQLSKDNKNQLKKVERQELKKEARELLKLYTQHMKIAGNQFFKIDMSVHAAQCFYSSGDWKGSAELFEKKGEFGQAAECYRKLGQEKKAANLFAQGGLFANSFECYERSEDWEGLIQCLYANKDKFSAVDREALIEKYFPLALNSVYKFYQSFNGGDQDDLMSEDQRGKLMQIRMKLKFQKSVSVIREEPELSDSESHSEDEEDKQEEQSIDIVNTTTVQEVIDTTSKVEAVKELQVAKAFGSNDFEVELLSNIDPEDEFLKASGHSFSLLGSQNQESSYSVISSQASEFSILSGSKMHSVIKSVASFQDLIQADQTLSLDSIKDQSQSDILDSSRFSVIAPNQDVFSEDIVIQKIIYYVSLFSEEVSLALKSYRSQDPLSQAIYEQQNVEDDFEYMLIELDELKPELLDLILGTLQRYELYRLCLILCNHYKLNYQGRFVAAIGQKYSNLTQFRTHLDKVNNKQWIAAQLSYSQVANCAMHNVFSFLSREQTESSIEWREACFEGLFLQGFWKKLVHLIDGDASMQLCFVMRESSMLKIQYLVHVAGISDASTITECIKNRKAFNRVLEQQQDTGLIKLVTVHEQAMDAIKSKSLAKILTFSKNQQHILKQIALTFNVIASDLQQCRPTILGRDLPIQCVFGLCEVAIKSLSTQNMVRQQQLYQCFNVSFLDNLDAFKNLNKNYMLVNQQSVIFSEIAKRQGVSLNIQRVQRVASFIKQKLSQGMFINSIKASIKIELSKPFTPSPSQLTENPDLALVCDLEFKWFLVPKLWVQEVTANYVLKFMLTLLSLKAELNMSLEEKFTLHNLLNQMAGFISRFGEQVELKKLYERVRLAVQPQGNELKFTTADVKLGYEFAYQEPLIFSEPYEISAKVDQLRFSFLRTILNESKIRIALIQICRKPQPNDISKLGIVPKQNQNGSLQVCITWLQRAFEKLHVDNFADFAYKAFKGFAMIDRCDILFELLQHKSTYQDAQKAKIKSIFDLIESHQHAKCNDLVSASKAMTRFLQCNYNLISIPNFQEIVDTMFTMSWFSLQIFNYSDRSVQIQQKSTQAIGRDFEILNQAELQDIRIKVGNIKQIQKCLEWVECLINSINGADEYASYKQQYEYGLIAVQTVLLGNLDKAILQTLWQTIRNICKGVLQGKCDLEFNSKVFNSFWQVIDAGVAQQKVTEAIKAVQQTKIWSYVSFSLGDRKLVANRINQIELDVQSCVNEETARFQSMVSARAKAAKLIQHKWTAIKLLSLKKPISDVRIAEALRAFGVLQRTSVVVMTSSLIQKSLDFQYVLGILKQAKIKHDALVNHTLSKETKLELTSLVKQFCECVRNCSEELRLWIASHDKTQLTNNATELEKKKFMRREKWDSAIQYQRKRRIMLKHFKANRQN